MDLGIYTMSNHDYHHGPGKESLSKGGLVQMQRSPAHYKAYMEEEQPSTPAMIFGADFHCAALEPELFKTRYVVAPQIDKRTKAGKEQFAELQLSLEENNQTIISQDDMDLINRMVDALFKNETAASLLSGGLAETSIFWNHPKWGFGCKVRPDYLNKNHKVVIDLKSTVDALPEAFSKAIANYLYHWQAGWYMAGVDEILPNEYSDFIIIAIEKKPPFAVQNYLISKDDIYLAEEQIKPLLNRYAECLANDTWPGPPAKLQSIRLPNWYVKKALD